MCLCVYVYMSAHGIQIGKSVMSLERFIIILAVDVLCNQWVIHRGALTIIINKSIVPRRRRYLSNLKKKNIYMNGD